MAKVPSARRIVECLPRCNRLRRLGTRVNRRDRFLRRRFAWWTALPLVFVPAIAAAQAPAAQPVPAPTPTSGTAPQVSAQQPAAEAEEIIEFSADQVTYDSDADVMTAVGSVRMQREGDYVAADQIVWNRKSGEVRALGNVAQGAARALRVAGYYKKISISYIVQRVIS